MHEDKTMRDFVRVFFSCYRCYKLSWWSKCLVNPPWKKDGGCTLNHNIKWALHSPKDSHIFAISVCCFVLTTLHVYARFQGFRTFLYVFQCHRFLLRSIQAIFLHIKCVKFPNVEKRKDVWRQKECAKKRVKRLLAIVLKRFRWSNFYVVLVFMKSSM